MPYRYYCIIFIVDNKFIYPVEFQYDNQNVVDFNDVDTIHETADSMLPLKKNNPHQVVAHLRK